MAKTHPSEGTEVATTDTYEMSEAGEGAINTVVKGLKAVKKQYRLFKVSIANEMTKALSKGWLGAIYVAALVAASVVVGFVWQIVIENAVVKAVTAFISTVATTIKSIAGFLQVDLVIALFQLGIMMNDKLYAKLAPLYEELGSLAEELSLDMGYITTFLEVDRSILQATASLTGWGFIKADADYAAGLSKWLGQIRKRLTEYAEDPNQIFTDIQKEIAQSNLDHASKELAGIWAAIDLAGDWVKDKGQILLKMVDEIDVQVKLMPEDIQKAIKPWYDSAVATVRKFEDEKWSPFWKEYKQFSDVIIDTFEMYDISIEEMQRRIDDPMDWLRSLLALPEKEQATLKGTLDEFLGGLFPARLKDRDSQVGILADTMAEWEQKNADYMALLGLYGPGPEFKELISPDLPEVKIPWYKETD